MESRARHEISVGGFDHTQKIRVYGESPLPHPALREEIVPQHQRRITSEDGGGASTQRRGRGWGVRSLPGPVSSGELLTAKTQALVARKRAQAERVAAWSGEGAHPPAPPVYIAGREELRFERASEEASR